jgi:hypothetical protein
MNNEPDVKRAKMENSDKSDEKQVITNVRKLLMFYFFRITAQKLKKHWKN